MHFAFLSLLISTILTYLISFPVRLIGSKYGLTDNPNYRKQHKSPIVRLGGSAMFLSGSLSLLFISFLGGFSNSIVNNLDLSYCILVGASSFFLIGFVDDLIGLSPLIRFICQSIIASIVWSQGLRIQVVDISIFSESTNLIEFSNIFSLFLTVIWLVGVTNAINWLDGLDGLVAGITLIYSLSLGYIGWSNNEIGEVIIAFTISGCSLGFLFHNFYPAKIIMGDGGSYLSGFSLATLAITNSSNPITLETPLVDNYIPIYVPLLVLFIPLVDMVSVILIRLVNNVSPFIADRNHIHHRILRLGLSHKRTVLTIYLLSFFFSSLAILADNSI